MSHYGMEVENTYPLVSFVEGALLQVLSVVPPFNPDTGQLVPITANSVNRKIYSQSPITFMNLGVLTDVKLKLSDLYRALSRE